MEDNMNDSGPQILWENFLWGNQICLPIKKLSRMRVQIMEKKVAQEEERKVQK